MAELSFLPRSRFPGPPITPLSMFFRGFVPGFLFFPARSLQSRIVSAREVVKIVRKQGINKMPTTDTEAP